MNLYEINNAIMECVDIETGEIIDTEKLDQLQLDRDSKIENIACWIKNLRSDAEQLKNESDRLLERKKAAENKAESLKRYLQSALNGEKFKSSKVAVYYKKSDSVDVLDMSKLPKWAVRIADPEPNKAEIKKVIKSGEKVPGAALKEYQSMIIK